MCGAEQFKRQLACSLQPFGDQRCAAAEHGVSELAVTGTKCTHFGGIERDPTHGGESSRVEVPTPSLEKPRPTEDIAALQDLQPVGAFVRNAQFERHLTRKDEKAGIGLFALPPQKLTGFEVPIAAAMRKGGDVGVLHSAAEWMPPQVLFYVVFLQSEPPSSGGFGRFFGASRHTHVERSAIWNP